MSQIKDFDEIYSDYLKSNKSIDDMDILKEDMTNLYEIIDPDNIIDTYSSDKIESLLQRIINNKDWEILLYLFDLELNYSYDLFKAEYIQTQVENLDYTKQWYEFLKKFYKNNNKNSMYIIYYIKNTRNEELFNTIFSENDIEQMVINNTRDFNFITTQLKSIPAITDLLKKYTISNKKKVDLKKQNNLPFQPNIRKDLIIEASTKYALLGKKLFEKCKTSQITFEEINERLSQLRRWNQGKTEWEDDFDHSEDDKDYLNSLLSPINLNTSFDDTPSSEEIDYFASVCGLTHDIVSIEDLFTYDWREKSIIYIDPKTNLQYIKVPKEGVIYHGMDIKYPFDMSRIPKYFGTLTTAYPYGFVSMKNARTAEQGKVIAFRLKRDILVLDISVIENWKILIPTENSAPKEVLIAAEECFNYKSNSDNILTRTSTTECDNIIYQYLLSLPQTSIADAAGARSQGKMTDEIVFVDSSKLELAGYELPYEIVMVNDLTSDNGVDCAFVIEARSSMNDRNFRLVTTLSEKDFREHKYQFAPEAGEKTFDNITPEQITKMRQQCMQRALGNFDIATIEEF